MLPRKAEDKGRALESTKEGTKRKKKEHNSKGCEGGKNNRKVWCLEAKEEAC